jgi:hypothetical protein
LEMRWTATAHDDAYGLLTMQGEPTAACLAKELFAQHVRHSDWVSFPDRAPDKPDIDAVVAWNDAGRLSGVFVNTGARAHALAASDWDLELAQCREVLRLDTGTGERIVREAFDGTVHLDGYGIAVVSNAPSPALTAAGPGLRA